jgi:Transcriptional Coactivator p15 (PC4)
LSDNYEKIIYENLDKGYQYRLTLSEFRETEYLHLRKYFLSYEGDWIPSKEGASIPCSIQNVFQVLDGLIDVCSRSESLDSIKTHFENKISSLKANTP